MARPRRYPAPRAAAYEPRMVMLIAAAERMRSRNTYLPPMFAERAGADIDPARTFNSASFGWAAAPTGGGGGDGAGGAGGGVIGRDPIDPLAP